MAKKVKITSENLLQVLVETVRSRFYPHWSEKRFYQMANSIQMQLLRFGFECHKRGWEFSPVELHGEITNLLDRMAQHAADIEYFPAYLAGAINHHIIQKAEEYSSRQTQIENRVAKILISLKPDRTIEHQSTCNAWAIAYRQRAIGERIKKAAKKQASQQEQLDLL